MAIEFRIIDADKRQYMISKQVNVIMASSQKSLQEKKQAFTNFCCNIGVICNDGQYYNRPATTPAEVFNFDWLIDSRDESVKATIPPRININEFEAFMVEKIGLINGWFDGRMDMDMDQFVKGQIRVVSGKKIYRMIYEGEIENENQIIEQIENRFKQAFFVLKGVMMRELDAEKEKYKKKLEELKQKMPFPPFLTPGIVSEYSIASSIGGPDRLNEVLLLLPTVYCPDTIAVTGNKLKKISEDIIKKLLRDDIYMQIRLYYDKGRFYWNKDFILVQRERTATTRFGHYHSTSDNDCTGNMPACKVSNIEDFEALIARLTEGMRTINTNGLANRTPRGLPSVTEILGSAIDIEELPPQRTRAGTTTDASGVWRVR